jgi:hypothetical protein
MRTKRKVKGNSTEVERLACPDWLARTLLIAHLPNTKLPPVVFGCGNAIREEFKKLCPNLDLDHFGTTYLPDGQVAFVTEPYDRLTMDHIEAFSQLNELCKKHGWWWWISPRSHHNPGVTLRYGIAEHPCTGFAEM